MLSDRVATLKCQLVFLNRIMFVDSKAVMANLVPKESQNFPPHSKLSAIHTRKTWSTCTERREQGWGERLHYIHQVKPPT